MFIAYLRQCKAKVNLKSCMMCPKICTLLEMSIVVRGKGTDWLSTWELPVVAIANQQPTATSTENKVSCSHWTYRQGSNQAITNLALLEIHHSYRSAERIWRPKPHISSFGRSRWLPINLTWLHSRRSENPTVHVDWLTHSAVHSICFSAVFPSSGFRCQVAGSQWDRAVSFDQATFVHVHWLWFAELFPHR